MTHCDAQILKDRRHMVGISSAILEQWDDALCLFIYFDNFQIMMRYVFTRLCMKIGANSGIWVR